MAEQEELRLTVTVDDRASAQLQALRGQLSSMGGGAQAAGMERVRRQTGEVGQGFAGLSRELSSFATRAGVVGGVVGAVTSKLWELGASFISRVTDVKAYSEALLALHRNAQFAGTSAAQFQSNMDLMRESSGVGAEQAAAGLQKFGEVWVDLQRQNSQARRSLTQGLQGQDLQNMQNLLSQMARTDTTTAMNLYLDYADRIEQFWIDQGQAARGAQVRREFLARGGLEGVERGRRFTPVAPEDIAREETRKAAAKSYREDSEATATAYDRIVRSAASILMSSEGTGSATGIIKVNMLAAATAAETLEDNMRKAREAADKAAPQPGTTGKPGDEWWQRFNPFNPANIAREKAAREAAGLPTLQTPEAPAPGQQFRDRLDAFRQREKLQLPPETTPPPLNLIPRGPSAPVVRPPGAAAPFRIPPAAAVTPPPPSTAVTPPPSFAERFGDWSEPAVPQRFTSGVEAVGPAVGRFMPAPDFLAGREAGLGTAGGSIEDSRAIELQTTATQATTEEMQRLREAFEAFRIPSPAVAAPVTELPPVDVEGPRPIIVPQASPFGERFGEWPQQPTAAGPSELPATPRAPSPSAFEGGTISLMGGATMDQNQVAQILDARALDRAASRDVNVNGTGKISVDVRAPAGTNVRAQGQGLFKTTEINRQTQMLPAEYGPAPATGVGAGQQ